MFPVQSAGKWTRASHDWIWFYFWFVGKVVRLFNYVIKLLSETNEMFIDTLYFLFFFPPILFRLAKTIISKLKLISSPYCALSVSNVCEPHLMECEECWFHSNKMADASVPGAGPSAVAENSSAVAENSRFLSNEEKANRRKTSYERRDSSRINLWDCFPPGWRELRDDNGGDLTFRIYFYSIVTKRYTSWRLTWWEFQ